MRSRAIYHVVPNRKQSVRQVLLGAVLAGVAFEALTLALPLYIKINGPEQEPRARPPRCSSS